MFANIFGNYLVKKKTITEDEFLSIKMLLDRTRVKLGLIAVSEKLTISLKCENITVRIDTCFIYLIYVYEFVSYFI